MLPYDETPALAARARLVARAVLGLVLDEQRPARFVYEYSANYFRQGVAGEAERKAELLAAIERESLLLVSSHIERSLLGTIVSRFARLNESEAVAVFRQSFLTFLAGTLAWDRDEREAFGRDLTMYLRLAAREGRVMQRQRGAPPVAGAFVDRCAFLVDPSMLAQAREAAARYQVQLESCAGEALRAAFRGLRAKAAAPVSHPRPRPGPKPKSKAKRKAKPKPKPKPKPKRLPRRKRKPRAVRRKSPPRPKRKPPRRAKTASRRARRRPKK
ncbi:MAG TPA: hypothetical protein VNJ52_01720 [Patescibacteria group bacterium]|nr:hypothetical protein [Patescibacteria group bacterium]